MIDSKSKLAAASAMFQLSWRAVFAAMVLIIPLSGAAYSAGSVPANQHLSLQVKTWRGEWLRTDFSKATVDFSEIISGGPPRDGIPPIDHPTFISQEDAQAWLQPEEPVLVFVRGEEARAYPLQVLIWHEIVNDTVAEIPIVITFCPLCNSALVYDRRVNGRILDFGTTGKLRNSDMVMWDRQTESWWQQLTGTGIVGVHTGVALTPLSSPLVSFTTFQRAFPTGKVLSRKTGHSRPYGMNPYVSYDSADNTQPFLMRAKVDKRLPATERVVTVESGGESRAYPYTRLNSVGVVNDRVAQADVVIFYRKGTISALDKRVIGDSREVGSGVVYSRKVGERTLTFKMGTDGWIDRETNSVWNQLGHAVGGPLKGERLAEFPHGNHFAFAWLAFRPNTTIWSK